MERMVLTAERVARAKEAEATQKKLGLLGVIVIFTALLVVLRSCASDSRTNSVPSHEYDSSAPLPYESEDDYVRRRALQQMSPAEFDAAKRGVDELREGGASDAELNRAIDAELRRRDESP